MFTVQFALFNLVCWGPFLTLGPLVAQTDLGGAGAWGVILAGYGAGAILGGLAVLGRRPARPLTVAGVALFGWAAPSACLAAGLPTVGVTAGAVVAGIGAAVFNALWTTTLQRHVRGEALARVNSYVTLGAFGLGPIGLAAAGPIAVAVGVTPVLITGAVWQMATASLVLALPAIRHLGSTPAVSRPATLEVDPSNLRTSGG